MKILQLLVFPLWGSGSGTYARKLSENLVKLGNDVAILAPETRELEGVKIFNIDLPIKAAFTMHPEWPDCKRFADLTDHEMSEYYMTWLKRIVEVVEEYKPDVIHVHHASMLAWIASYIKSIYGINYIISVHGTCVMNASIDLRYVSQTRIALERSEFIVPVSGDTRNWMLKVFGRRFAWKSRVITGGIDIKVFPKNIEIKSLEEKYDMKSKNVVLFSGKLTKIKGVDYLIKAAPQINGHIYIAGDGEERKNLEALVEKMGITNVTFLGYFDKADASTLRELYARANVAVFPSVWDEPLGLVILESMAASTPVVASRKGGIPLAVKNGVNGFLVRARSSKEIAAAVNKILESPTLQKTMGEAARKIAEEKFSWKLIGQSFVKLYDVASNKAESSRANRRLRRQQQARQAAQIVEEKKHLRTHNVDLA
jgi:glycogen(starch) synthase